MSYIISGIEVRQAQAGTDYIISLLRPILPGIVHMAYNGLAYISTDKEKSHNFRNLYRNWQYSQIMDQKDEEDKKEGGRYSPYVSLGKTALAMSICPFKTLV